MSETTKLPLTFEEFWARYWLTTEARLAQKVATEILDKAAADNAKSKIYELAWRP